MPWRPGFTPVAADVHAGGVYVGTVEASTPAAPVDLRLARCGMTPASISGSIRCHAAPSRPMTAALSITRRTLRPDICNQTAYGALVEIRLLEDREAPGTRVRRFQKNSN